MNSTRSFIVIAHVLVALAAAPPTLAAAPEPSEADVAPEPDEPLDLEHGPIDEDALLERLETVAEPPLPTTTPPARPAQAPARRWPPAFLGLVRDHLHPRDEELTQLRKAGFVVLERSVAHPARAYHTIYTEDLPVFVTMDSLFHAIAAGQEAMGEAIEKRYLAPRAARALRTLHEHLAATWASWPHAEALDLYLSIARTLLAGRDVALVAPVPAPAVALERTGWLSAALAATPHLDATLMGRPHPLDLSLLQPRGRYAGDPELERWFRAMGWLGLVELNLVSRDCRSSTLSPEPDPSPTPDEAVIALELAFLADESGALDDLVALSDTLDDLVAPRVDVAPDALLALAADAGIDRQALAREPASELQRRLEAAIGSLYPRTAATHIMPTVARQPVVATVLGLRPTEATGGLAALLDPQVPGRVALDGLDVAFALGHDRALAHLGPALAAHPELARGLERARQAFAGVPALGTLRLAWLHAVLALSQPPAAEVTAPSFMRSEAFADQRINSAVAAYAQLRHAHVLYEAQTFSVGGCDIPDGYVEPAPAVLAALRAFAARGATLADRIDPDDALGVRGYFARMERVLAALARIVAHELAGTPLTRDERRFLHQIAEEEALAYTNTMTFDGWYYDLFFTRERVTDGGEGLLARLEPKPNRAVTAAAEALRPEDADFLAPGDLVVDVATVMHDSVSHLGTRLPRFALFVVDVGGPPRVMVGPVSDAYAQATAWPERLTDATARTAPEGARHSPWSAGHAPWLRRFEPEPDLQAGIDFWEGGWVIDLVADRPTPVELRVVGPEDRVLSRVALTAGPRAKAVKLACPTSGDEAICDATPVLVVGRRELRFEDEMGFTPVVLGRYRQVDPDADAVLPE